MFVVSSWATNGLRLNVALATPQAAWAARRAGRRDGATGVQSTACGKSVPHFAVPALLPKLCYWELSEIGVDVP